MLGTNINKNTTTQAEFSEIEMHMNDKETDHTSNKHGSKISTNTEEITHKTTANNAGTGDINNRFKKKEIINKQQILQNNYIVNKSAKPIGDIHPQILQTSQHKMQASTPRTIIETRYTNIGIKQPQQGY